MQPTSRSLPLRPSRPPSRLRRRQGPPCPLCGGELCGHGHRRGLSCPGCFSRWARLCRPRCCQYISLELAIVVCSENRFTKARLRPAHGWDSEQKKRWYKIISGLVCSQDQGTASSSTGTSALPLQSCVRLAGITAIPLEGPSLRNGSKVGTPYGVLHSCPLHPALPTQPRFLRPTAT